MFVYPYRVISFRVVTMLVDAFICALFFDLSNVLSPVTLHTEGQVDGVLGLAPHLVSYFKTSIASAVRKVRSRDHVSAAFGIRTALAWRASASRT